MSFQAELFDELHPVTDEVTIMVGNGASVPAHGTGTLTLRGTEGELRLERVLYVPDLTANLISLSQLMTNGLGLTTKGLKS